MGGTEIPSIEGDLLEYGLLSHGQEWVVTITANDGLTDSDSVDIAFDFFNTPPTICDINITPALPYLGDSVQCDASANDEEGDSIEIEYTWTITTTNEDGEEDSESSDKFHSLGCSLLESNALKSLMHVQSVISSRILHLLSLSVLCTGHPLNKSIK